MKSVATIDWCTFSVKGAEDPKAVIAQYLRIDPALFEDQPFGNYGYSKSLNFGGLMVYYAPPEGRIMDMGVCVSMSGKGCRIFEKHTQYEKNGKTPFYKLFAVCHVDPMVSFTRIDLAVDDKDGYLDLDVICDAVDDDAINSRLQERHYIRGRFGKKKAGTTVYLGARKSAFNIRIYDKAKEFYKRDEDGYYSHWVRLEMEMRRQNANGCVAAIVNTENLGVLAAGILNDKLAFIERDDSNISRCQICKWWLDFVDMVGSISLVSKEDMVHTLEQKLDWLKRSVAPTLSLIVDAKGWFIIRDILALGLESRTPKQMALLQDYRNAYQWRPSVLDPDHSVADLAGVDIDVRAAD